VGKSKDTRGELIVIKKYANRRLYNTDTSTYVTLEDLGQMVRSDRDFVVYDAKSGEDLTHSVLTQIIVEQESKGHNLLPIPFLRQLIRFYDDSVGKLVPSYLQFSLDSLTKEQEKFRAQINEAFGVSAFDSMQEQAKKNMAMFEQALGMFTPFGKPSGNSPENSASSKTSKTDSTHKKSTSGKEDELYELKNQLSEMQKQIDKLSE
jgi:polyhydroxyalkanoate synthesis repressor PhaR